MRTAEQEERGAGALKLFTIIKKALILDLINQTYVTRLGQTAEKHV